MSEITRLFMFDREEDDLLGKRNLLFWRALLGHVQADRSISTEDFVVDIGCHSGGLLSLVIDRFSPSRVIGIEPLKKARNSAKECLQGRGVDVQLYTKDSWSKIPSGEVGLLLCHEVLPFFEDLKLLMSNVFRVLKPGSFAYLVSGCHTENPIWFEWKRQLEQQGQAVYDHAPLDLIGAGAATGLSPSIRPLRESGWAHYNPLEEGQFKYPSVELLLDHQFKHKLLFRFQRPYE